MFKLLSKESNIFSIPVYIGILLLVVISFNFLNFNYLNLFSSTITFTGISLGYFCFNGIGLNNQTHLPLFLYTCFVIAFYPGYLDIGIATALLTNSFLLLILTNQDQEISQRSFLLIGAILAINYLVLPTTWPLILFVLLHVVATSSRIGLQIFRLILGALLVVLSYLSVAYFLRMNSWDDAYFPFSGFYFMENFGKLYILIPVALLLIYAVFDHFMNFHKKSPISRYKYTFVLIFTLSQIITLFLYMGNHYEYLLFLAVPISIILSRVLRFLPKYSLKEVGLWIIIICLAVYKILNTISFL